MVLMLAIWKTKDETPTGGVVISVTVPLALNCMVMVRLMRTVSGPEMGTADRRSKTTLPGELRSGPGTNSLRE